MIIFGEEKSIRVSIQTRTLCDLEKVRIIKVVEGRKEEDARAAIASLPERVRAGMKAIVMDIWPAFINAAGKDLPGADVVFDRFHVSKHMGEAVDEVRRMEHKELLQQGDTRLVRFKYDWLRNEPNKDPVRRDAFQALKASELNTARARASRRVT